jgi:protein-tyrosine phosphatase
MKNILFVCTGNTCRSPIAEALLKRIAKQNNLMMVVQSAGTNTVNGMPASAHAIKVMEEKGIDLTQHKSQQITGDLLQWADSVITMGKTHQDYLKQSLIEKEIVTIHEAAELGNDDICDPWGRDISVYRSCANEIEKLIQMMIDKEKIGI